MKIFITLILLIVSSFGLKAAVFTSIVSGGYSAATTWSVVGVDSDGIPDNNDDVTISIGHNVSLSVSANAKTLTINGSFTMNSLSMLVWGNLTNNGTSFGNGTWQFRAVGTYSGNPINNFGTIYFYTNYTIAAGVTLSKGGGISVSSGALVNNNGNITLTAGTLDIFSGGTWRNNAGSSINVSSNVINAGTLDCSANSNTFTYSTLYYNTIMCNNATYYNLVVTSDVSSTKSLNGTLNVLNDLTISSLARLGWASNTINLGGNWTNSAGLDGTSMGTINFNGSGTQTITRPWLERFNNMTISGTGTVNLANHQTSNGTLTISSGTFDVSASNYNLNVKGNFIHSAGTFNARNGIVLFSGTAAQMISGAATTTFYDLSSTNTSGGVNVVGAAVVSNILTVSSNSFGTSGSGTIVLTATAATTYARIAALGVGASLTGTGWSVQSYINGPITAYWQYLGSPIAGNLLSDWDLDTRFYMSGVGGNDGNACCPIFYSVRTYNEPSNTYSNIITTGTSLTAGRGFMVWMGDNMINLASPLVFDSKGVPNQGTVLRAVTAGGAGGGYNLVSNPYACPITYASVVASSGNLGPNFLILTETGAYVTNPNGGVIAPSQGFLCVATSSGNMTVTESAKTTATNPNIIRTINPENFLRIRSGNAINGLGGEAVIQIKTEAHNGYELGHDMPFIASPYDDATNLWTVDKDGKDLLLNALNGNEDKLDIPMVVTAGTPGDQLLTFSGLNGFTSYTCATLEDVATGQLIDLKNHDTYSFPAVAAGEKHNFVIHFERTGICPLSEQNIAPSLDASSQVFVNNGNILVKFGFEEMTDVSITVFDVLGKEVSVPKNFTVSNETIALENPGAHGIYLVRITKGDEIVTKKIYL